METSIVYSIFLVVIQVVIELDLVSWFEVVSHDVSVDIINFDVNENKDVHLRSLHVISDLT